MITFHCPIEVLGVADMHPLALVSISCYLGTEAEQQIGGQKPGKGYRFHSGGFLPFMWGITRGK